MNVIETSNQIFENFELWVVSISKFGLVTTTINLFQKLRLDLQMVFAQKFEFSSQNVSISLLKNLIFQPSESRLSSIMQN